MTPEELLIKKKKLSDINQELILIKSHNSAFNQFSGINQLNIFQKKLKEKSEEMSSIIEEIELIKKNMKGIQDSINQYNAQSNMSYIEKKGKEIEKKFSLIDKIQLEIDEIEKKTRLCKGPAYVRFCSLIAARDHIGVN